MLYAVNTKHKEYEGTSRFLIVANSIEAARDACSDQYTEVLEVTSAVETVIVQEYDGLCMLETR